jgi:hypothetical protein
MRRFFQAAILTGPERHRATQSRTIRRVGSRREYRQAGAVMIRW